MNSSPAAWREPDLALPVPGVLVDANILVDVTEDHPTWGAWSSAMLAYLADRAPLVINPIVYAEVSVGFAETEELDAALPPDLYRRDPLPWDAAFLAGRVFVAYRRRGGARRSPLPDFYIGAHAAVAGLALLTRDASRYRSYFPSLRIVAPEP